MNLLCGALKNLWLDFYNKYVLSLDDKTKATVGGVLVIASIFVFVLSTKGHDKSQMVNSWFLFWVSMLLFMAGGFYLFFA